VSRLFDDDLISGFFHFHESQDVVFRQAEIMIVRKYLTNTQYSDNRMERKVKTLVSARPDSVDVTMCI